MHQNIKPPKYTGRLTCPDVFCTLQALSLFPERVSESNLKAVNALKGVGKGTMERVSGVWGLLLVGAAAATIAT